MADGGGRSLEAVTQFNFLADLLSQFGGNIESFRLAVNEYGKLELGMELLSVGAMAGGPPAGTFAFNEGTGQHFAESSEATDESAAQIEVGVIAGHT